MEEHLAKDNGLKLDGLDYRLGRKLTVDAKAETFVDAPEADKLLTRPYRKPFVVPERSPDDSATEAHRGPRRETWPSVARVDFVQPGSSMVVAMIIDQAIRTATTQVARPTLAMKAPRAARSSGPGRCPRRRGSPRRRGRPSAGPRGWSVP